MSHGPQWDAGPPWSSDHGRPWSRRSHAVRPLRSTGNGGVLTEGEEEQAAAVVISDRWLWSMERWRKRQHEVR
jgi:hypothetical protein